VPFSLRSKATVIVVNLEPLEGVPYLFETTNQVLPVTSEINGDAVAAKMKRRKLVDVSQ